MSQLAPKHGLLLPMSEAVGKDSAAACISDCRQRYNAAGAIAADAGVLPAKVLPQLPPPPHTHTHTRVCAHEHVHTPSSPFSAARTLTVLLACDAAQT